MTDPWKRQLIWQSVVEKETLHYASLEEKKPKSTAVQTSAEVSEPVVVEEPKQTRPDPYAEFSKKLPSLAVSASSTGSLHYKYNRLRAKADECEDDEPHRDYRHGQAKRFGERNVRGGFFTS